MKNIPRLRFPEFEGCGKWEEKTLGEICSSFEYGMNAAAKPYDGQNKYIRITDIDENTNTYKNSNPTSPDGALEEKYIVQEDDILFARTGASTGKTYLYNGKDGKLYYAGFLIRGRVKKEYNSYFIFINTLLDSYRKWVAVESARSGQPGINAEQYSKYKAVITTFPEQQKIADCLSSLDEAISCYEEELLLLKDHKKGLLQNLFPKEGEKVPALRFEEFRDCGEWEETSIKSVCSISTGKSNTQDKIENGEYPFYVRSATVEKSDKYLFDEEAILTVGDGVGTGKVYHYVHGKYDLHQRVYRLFNFQKIIGRFLFYFFSDKFHKRVNTMSAKNSVDSVRMDMIANMPLPYPNINEQQKIADCLSSLDESINAQEEELNKLKEHKKGLLQNLFPQN